MYNYLILNSKFLSMNHRTYALGMFIIEQLPTFHAQTIRLNALAKRVTAVHPNISKLTEKICRDAIQIRSRHRTNSSRI